jgi:hypothetical protein
MVGRSKRRRKAPASQAPESLESDIAAQSKERPHQKKRPSTTMVSDDSDHNHDTPATDAALSQELSDEQELGRFLQYLLIITSLEQVTLLTY